MVLEDVRGLTGGRLLVCVASSHHADTVVVVHLDHLVQGLEVKEADTLLHELHTPAAKQTSAMSEAQIQRYSLPNEARHVSEDLLEVDIATVYVVATLRQLCTNVREQCSSLDRTAFFVLAVDASNSPEDLLGKRLVQNLADLELVAPAEGRGHHGYRVVYPQLPRNPSRSVLGLQTMGRPYLARRNFMSRTLTRASLLGALGSI